MNNNEKVYDMNRINTLLHYEKIPSFTMTKEQKEYLAGYRAQVEARTPVVVKEDTEIKIRKPLSRELEEVKNEEIVNAVAELVEEATKNTKKKKTRKKSTKKNAEKVEEAPKTEETEETEEVKE